MAKTGRKKLEKVGIMEKHKKTPDFDFISGQNRVFERTYRHRYSYFLPIRRSKASFNLSRNGVGVFRIFKSPKVRDRLWSNLILNTF